MTSLLIVGAGSFSTEVEELARLLGYTDIAFLDDHPEKALPRPRRHVADRGPARHL